MRERKDKIARLTEPLFDLLCALAEKGERCPNTIGLREELGCSERSIDDAVSSLKDLGRIDCVNRGAGGRIITILVGSQAGKSTSGGGIYYPREVGGNVARDDDLMNYGKGFGSQNIADPGDGGPIRLSKPLAHTAGGVGRYF